MTGAILELQSNSAKLPAQDHSFAKSLLKWRQDGKQLSEKQLYWVGRLAQKAQGIPDFTEIAQLIGQYKGVVTLFEKAAQKLKCPKIAIMSESGTNLSLKATINKTGKIFAVSVYAGVAYQSFAGAIDADGAFKKSGALSEQNEGSMFALLAAIAKNPARASPK